MQDPPAGRAGTAGGPPPDVYDGQIRLVGRHAEAEKRAVMGCERARAQRADRARVRS